MSRDSEIFWADDVGAYLDRDELTEFQIFQLDGEPFPSAENPMPVESIRGNVTVELDKRKRKNKSGRKTVSKGYKPSQFTVVFKVFTLDQWNDYRVLVPQINPRLAANKNKTRRVYHPFLDPYDITQATVSTMELPDYEGTLIAKVAITFTEIFEDNTTGNANKHLKGANLEETVAIDADFVSDEGPPPAPRLTP